MKRRLVFLSMLLLVAAAGSGCGYNTLQSQSQNVKAKWSNVETQLQRRADLIPNLVETAKMSAVQEQEVFGQIAQARSQLLNSINQQPAGEGGDKSPEQKEAVIAAANSFGGTVGRLLSLQEAYPELRSNQNFLRVQDELAGTENRIATARNDYNTAVQQYNTTRGSFPTVMFAKLYGFKEEPFYKADPGSQQVPSVGGANDLRRNQNR
jgi:LemA protein